MRCVALLATEMVSWATARCISDGKVKVSQGAGLKVNVGKPGPAVGFFAVAGPSLPMGG